MPDEMNVCVSHFRIAEMGDHFRKAEMGDHFRRLKWETLTQRLCTPSELT